MRISVDINNVKLIEKEQIESGEYNVTPCLFTFSEEYDGLIKTAVFTNKKNEAYNMLIQDNECQIPYEVLEKEGAVELGVFGYAIEDDDLELRYSPKPCLFAVTKGSYKEAENSTPPTPTQFEQYEQALAEGLAEVANVDIDASKVEHTATITITDRTGTEKSVQIQDGIDGIDGVGLNYNWSGTSLGIKREDEGSYEYVNLKGDKGDAGAIKMVIVQELPTTGQDDTIYLVPLETPETEENKYAEYVWIDNEWELLGKIGIQVDLTDYYTKTETNNLLDTKQSLIDSTHKLSADLVDDTNTTNKFVTTSEKSTWNAKYDKPSGGIPKTDLASDVQTSLGKADTAIQTHQDISGKEDKSNKVTSLSSLSTDTQYPSAKCVYDIVGDIETILTTLDIGGGIV